MIMFLTKQNAKKCTVDLIDSKIIIIIQQNRVDKEKKCRQQTTGLDRQSDRQTVEIDNALKSRQQYQQRYHMYTELCYKYLTKKIIQEKTLRIVSSYSMTQGYKVLLHKLFEYTNNRSVALVLYISSGHDNVLKPIIYNLIFLYIYTI